MAKVEVQDRAFRDEQTKRAARQFQIPEAHILGYALILWHDSQEAGLTVASKEQILAWLDTDRHVCLEHCFSILQASGHLRATRDENLFEIAGNEAAIARVKVLKKRAKEASKARWSRVSDSKKLPKKADATSIAYASPQAMPDKSTRVQREKIRKPASQTAAPVPPNEPPVSAELLPAVPSEPSGSQVWDAYRAAYFARYKVEPVRNARTNSLCKQLTKRLGGDGAISVVKFFLTHNKSFYVAKAHDIGLCVADAEALHTQFVGGHRITSSEAKNADQTAGNLQAASFVMEKIKRGEL